MHRHGALIILAAIERAEYISSFTRADLKMSSSWIELARGCEFVSAALADELHKAGIKVREIAFSEPYTVQSLSAHTLNVTLANGETREIEFITRELILAGSTAEDARVDVEAKIRAFAAGLVRQ